MFEVRTLKGPFSSLKTGFFWNRFVPMKKGIFFRRVKVKRRFQRLHNCTITTFSSTFTAVTDTDVHAITKRSTGLFVLRRAKTISSSAVSSSSGNTGIAIGDSPASLLLSEGEWSAQLVGTPASCASPSRVASISSRPRKCLLINAQLQHSLLHLSISIKK